MISAAGECKVLQSSTTELEPFQQAGSGIVHQFKLDWPSGLLLNDGRIRSNFPIANDIADPDFYQIAAAGSNSDNPMTRLLGP